MTSKKHYGKQTGRSITHELPTPAGGVRLETFVPWTLVRRGLKKRVITPLDAPQEFLAEAKQERAAQAAAQDSALMRALGLAHHWQRLLDDGRYGSMRDQLADKSMGYESSYVACRRTSDAVRALRGRPGVIRQPRS